MNIIFFKFMVTIKREQQCTSQYNSLINKVQIRPDIFRVQNQISQKMVLCLLQIKTQFWCNVRLRQVSGFDSELVRIYTTDFQLFFVFFPTCYVALLDTIISIFIPVVHMISSRHLEYELQANRIIFQTYGFRTQTEKEFGKMFKITGSKTSFPKITNLVTLLVFYHGSILIYHSFIL